jgi:hypothetical protein
MIYTLDRKTRTSIPIFKRRGKSWIVVGEIPTIDFAFFLFFENGDGRLK